MARNNSPKKAASSKNNDVSTGDLFDTNGNRNVPLEITNYQSQPSASEEIRTESSVKGSRSNSKKNLKKGFTLQSPIYVEIHKANLLQFISAAIIFPYKYSNQGAFTDTQSLNPSTLILSNGIIARNSEDLILLQVDANVIKESLLTVVDEIGFYACGIPMSRVLKIFTQKNEVKKKLVDDALIRDAGYLPDKLITVGFPKSIPPVNYGASKELEADIGNKLSKFDKILGLIAGTSNYAILTSNQSNVFKSISDHTLYAMQAVQPDFAKEVLSNERISEYYKWLFTNTCPDDRIILRWVFNRVYNDSNFTDNDTLEFEALCVDSKSFGEEEKQVTQIFSLLKNSIERKKALTEILKLSSRHSLALYVFAYLRIYASRQNPELGRLDLLHSGHSKYSEYAFATLNFFFGYKILRNSEDRVNVENIRLLRNFKNSSRPSIKLTLNNYFDYAVIDNVFQNVFQIELKDSNYVLYPNATKQMTDPKSKLEGFLADVFDLYGKQYQVIRKIDPLDELIPMINLLPSEIFAFSEFGLVCYRLGLKMNSYSVVDILKNPSLIRSQFSYSKNGLMDAIKEGKLDIDEMKQRIALSQKHKEI
jgi:hypothetical protein